MQIDSIATGIDEIKRMLINHRDELPVSYDTTDRENTDGVDPSVLGDRIVGGLLKMGG